VAGGVAWHVAVDAAVLWALLAPGGQRLGAVPLGVALQAGRPVMPDTLVGADVDVRVVAGGAAQFLLALAPPEALPLVHLLDVVARLAVHAGPAVADEDREERLQRQPGAEVAHPAAAAQHPGLAGEVALLADGLPQGVRELAGVDDGVIGRPHGGVP